jgi:hypothetical protein
MIEQDKIDFIKMKIAQTYNCFGQGSITRPGTESPLSLAMSTKPLAFALGVPVEQVIYTVMQWDAYLDGRLKGSNPDGSANNITRTV